MQKEMHLIVLWENARYKEREILQDIQKNLRIKECYDVTWTPEMVVSNFGRFYGVKLDEVSSKIAECGNGSFLLIIVEDEEPEYGFAETSRGYKWVNKKLFFLKSKYRLWTGGGHKVHATNSVVETSHDLTLLIGKNYEDYQKSSPEIWDGQYKVLTRDLQGASGWKSFEELFYVLQNTSRYVLLRGEDIIKTLCVSEKHGDIDILTDDYDNLTRLINGVPVINVYRPHFEVSVGGLPYCFDVWDVRRRYYDSCWMKDMLDTAISIDGICFLSAENKFYELIYHVLVHKPSAAKDYYQAAEMMLKNLQGDRIFDAEKYDFPFDYYYTLLCCFMKAHGYTFSCPDDKSLFYRKDIARIDEITNYLQKNYFIMDIQPYMMHHCTGSGYMYFVGNYQETRLFIKWGGLGAACKTEFKYAQMFCALNSAFFLTPYFYECDGDKKFVALEYCKSCSLEQILHDGVLEEAQKEKLLSELKELSLILERARCIHRDIKPSNILITESGQLKLIDYQFVLPLKSYTVKEILQQDLMHISNLGEEYALGSFKWDDFYSIAKIMKEIGVSSASQKALNEVEALVGKNVLLFQPIGYGKYWLKKIKYKILSVLALPRGYRILYSGKYEQVKNLIKKIRFWQVRYAQR